MNISIKTTPDAGSLLRERLSGSLPPASAYVPDFKTREQDEFILISDGDKPVATFHRQWLLLDMREFYPDGRANATLSIRRPYHNVDFRGAILPCNWRIKSQMVDSTTNMVTVLETGARLVLLIDETFGEDERGYSEITMTYDCELGCYAVDKQGALALHSPCTVEAANLWDGGAGRAWPEDTTLRYTLWTNVEGGLTYFPHNPLTPNLPGNGDVNGQRRRLPIGGFIAMGERSKSNPVIEILDSHTAAIGCSTCSAFYDEHIFQGCPAPIDDTGRHRWRFHARLVSIPQSAMTFLRGQADILEMSDTPDQYDNWKFLDFIRSAGRQVQPFDISLPFRLGEVNHFDSPIDPRQELIGLYWHFTPQPYGRVTWDRQAKALLIEGRDSRADLCSVPCGPSICCHENTGYRLSAKVRTELESDAAAWLELSPFLWSPSEIKEPIRSPQLTGMTEGTIISVAIPPQPSGNDYLAIALRMKGKGKVWFDEVELIPMRR